MKTDQKDTVSASDRELLQKVQEVINGGKPPMLIGPEGGHIHMPSALFHVLTQATRSLLSGQSVQIISGGEEFTTQGAADFLGCSRPFLVKLLDSGQIDFHYVGTHRRVSLKNLEEYRKLRDGKRKAALAKVTQVADCEDYEQGFTSEDDS